MNTATNEPEKHLLRNAQRTIADCKDHCGTKTKVYKIFKKSRSTNKKAPLNGALDHFELFYSPVTSNSTSVVLPLPKSIVALYVPSSFTSSVMLIRLRSISYPFWSRIARVS